MITPIKNTASLEFTHFMLSPCFVVLYVCVCVCVCHTASVSSLSTAVGKHYISTQAKTRWIIDKTCFPNCWPCLLTNWVWRHLVTTCYLDNERELERREKKQQDNKCTFKQKKKTCKCHYYVLLLIIINVGRKIVVKNERQAFKKSPNVSNSTIIFNYQC